MRVLALAETPDPGWWLGSAGTVLSAWVSLAVEGVPPGCLASPGRAPPEELRVEQGSGPRADRAIFTGPFDALLRHLDEAAERSPPLRTLAEAVRAAVRGYRTRREEPARTLIVGILNVTPDSFSDGGRFIDPDFSLRRGLEMVDEGADWIDVGGESTRPGAREVPVAEELRRVEPVVRRLAAEISCPVSIDTRKAVVAEACLAAGATVVNDVSAMTHDPRMAQVVAASRATLVLMHMSGDPGTMQRRARYEDVVADTARYLRERAAAAVTAGVDPGRIWIDPGFGFGKTVKHNLSLIARLREYTSIGLPVLIGTSRKSTVAAVLGGLPPDERLEGTAATVALAVMNGAAAVRVHDVRAMARVARMVDAVRLTNDERRATTDGERRTIHD